MKFLKQQYCETFAFLRGPLRPFLRNTCIAFFVIYLIFLVSGLFSSAVLDMLTAYMRNVVENAQIVNQDGGIDALRILSNNLRAAFLSIAYGLFPFLYLPAMAIGVNAAMLGGVTALYQVHGQSMAYLAAGLLPHGIIEIPTLLIAFACGLYLCHEVTVRFRKQEEPPVPFSQTLFSLVRVYLTIITPALIVASLLEAYVTPLCMAMFQ